MMMNHACSSGKLHLRQSKQKHSCNVTHGKYLDHQVYLKPIMYSLVLICLYNRFSMSYLTKNNLPGDSNEYLFSFFHVECQIKKIQKKSQVDKAVEGFEVGTCQTNSSHTEYRILPEIVH